MWFLIAVIHNRHRSSKKSPNSKLGGIGVGQPRWQWERASDNKSCSIYVDQKSKLKIGSWWLTTVHSGGPTTLADMAWTVTDVFHIVHLKINRWRLVPWSVNHTGSGTANTLPPPSTTTLFSNNTNHGRSSPVCSRKQYCRRVLDLSLFLGENNWVFWWNLVEITPP